MRRFFKYIEPIWLGADGKMSLRAVLAIAFSVDFVRNLSHAIFKWEIGRSLEGLSMVLGIEAGLIIALLGITAWSNVSVTKINADSASTPPSPPVVQKADTVNVISKKEEPVQDL